MASIVVAGDTSGTVTLTAPLVAGTTTLTLPTVNGTVITTGSTTGVNASAISTGTLARARLPAGSVLQVISVVDGTQVTTSSGSYVSSTVAASITPTSSSSKIFISVALCVDTLSSGTQGMTTIYKNNTTNLALGLSNDAFNDSFNTGGRLISTVSMQYLDSPATTSSTTYTVYLKASSGSVNLNVGAGSVITLMEIAA